MDNKCTGICQLFFLTRKLDENQPGCAVEKSKKLVNSFLKNPF